MVGDGDLLGFRQGYYDLLVSLLWREPPGDLVASLATGLTDRARGARQLHPRLGDGWEAIGRYLDAQGGPDLAGGVADEFVGLFVGPSPELNLYESFYLAGGVYDRPLAAVRGFLATLGIAKDEGYAEPEDSLAFELDVTRTLVRRQGAAGDRAEEERLADLQATFLKRHLLVWGREAGRDLAGAAGAAFYRGVGHLVEGFLDLEARLVRDRGEEDVRTLEAARAQFARFPAWRGPLADFPGVPHEPEPPAGAEPE